MGRLYQDIFLCLQELTGINFPNLIQPKGVFPMARLKSSSAVIEKAQTRLASLSSIDSALDLGSGLTLAAYRADIQDAQATLEAYNNLLSQADEAANQLHAAEADLRSHSERMLAGVAAKYGKDSNEYEMAGGVRKSEIKRPARKKQAA
jgi:uncharacterized protein YhaN